MKTISKLFFVTLLTLILPSKTAFAQCLPPDLSFANPTLVQGVARQEGAVYKFSDVTPGIDCFITLKKFNGGASLVSMENVGLGYNDAWQPIIDGPGTPVGNKSWIDWEVTFKTTAGLNFSFSCLAICAIDVDGDAGNLGEFIESAGQASYEIPFPTALTVTDHGSGKIEAQGPVNNRAGIDTFSLDVRINYYFNGLDTIQLKIGQTVLGPGTGGATARYNSIYFKKVILNPFIILPVAFIDVKAERGSNMLHNISWEMAAGGTTAARFEVEYSEDNLNWNVAASIAAENGKTAYHVTYQYSGNKTVYYRIRAFDSNGKSTLSRIENIPKVQEDVVIRVTPNPVNDYIQIYLSKTNISTTKRIQLVNLNGQKVVDISCRQQSIPINTSKLANGYYIVNIVDNGKIYRSQILVKHP